MNIHDLFETSQFSKLRQYLHGLKNQGDGLVIATPMNPHGGEDLAQIYADKSPHEKSVFHMDNNKRFRLGELHLRLLGKQFIKQRGVFGLPERSFIIIGMSLREAIALGRTWEQTSVIYAQKTDRGLEFSIVATGGSQIEVESMVREFSIADDDLSDYYSQVGRTKWVIPFYDREAEERAGYRKGQSDLKDKAA